MCIMQSNKVQKKIQTSILERVHKNIKVGVKSSFHRNMRFKVIYLVWKFYIFIMVSFIQHLHSVHLIYVQFKYGVQGEFSCSYDI